MKIEIPPFLQKALGSLTALRATAASRNLTNPARDWYLALLLSAVLTLVLLSVSVVMFFAVGTDAALYADVSGAEGPSVDRSLLRETLTFFKGEEDEFTALRSLKPTIPAPF
jgi:hypothetical protein